MMATSSSISRSIALRRRGGRCLIRSLQGVVPYSSSSVGALCNGSTASRVMGRTAKIAQSSPSASGAAPRHRIGTARMHPGRYRGSATPQLRTLSNLARASESTIAAAAAATTGADDRGDSWRLHYAAAALGAFALASGAVSNSPSPSTTNEEDGGTRLESLTLGLSPLFASSAAQCQSATAVMNHGGANGSSGSPASTSSSYPISSPSSDVPAVGGVSGGGGARPVKARNVMIHRMRSVRGRELDDKYIVDWKTVLGEGAYGSVHPARLRATGEKVRHWECMTPKNSSCRIPRFDGT
jgi:hypothetical protein